MNIDLLISSLNNLKISGNENDPEMKYFQREIKKQAMPFGGEYKAKWLFSDWSEKIWRTAGGKKTRQNEKGNWIATNNIYWDVVLSDGHKLTDECYAFLLDSCKKISFLYREGLILVEGKPPSIASWYSFTRELLMFATWLVLEKERYLPEKNAFSLMDQFGLERLFNCLARGGWSEALEVSERAVQFLYEQAFSEDCPSRVLNNIENLSSDVIDRIITWLTLNRCYAARGGCISRRFLSKAICCPEGLLSTERVSTILRQFEPKLFHSTLLLPSVLTTEYPSQRTITRKDALRYLDYASANIHTRSLACILKAYRHLPNGLPNPKHLSEIKIIHRELNHRRISKHTPFIPIEIGLAYLDEALLWVSEYGEAIVDYYLVVFKKLNERASISNGTIAQISFKESPHILLASPLPEVLVQAGFNINRITPARGTERDMKRLRQLTSLNEVINIYYGAVIILIGMLKPSRQIEISSLKIDCLLSDGKGQYWLNSELGKRTISDQRANTGGMPIPVITAKAIQQLHRLSIGLMDIYKEKDLYKKSQLFYLPNENRLGTSRNQMNGFVDGYLDIFCDYVGLTPDKFGRRWYLRVHEMRKWFLLLLFWSGRYDVIDAARWIAGHTSVQHLYAYIEREFPSSQLGELEAEWAVDRLAEYESTKIVSDGTEIGLIDLYKKILGHFRVDALSLVEERNWKNYVKILFEEDYHLEPYTINSKELEKNYCIAIRAEKRMEYKHE